MQYPHEFPLQNHKRWGSTKPFRRSDARRQSGRVGRWIAECGRREYAGAMLDGVSDAYSLILFDKAS